MTEITFSKPITSSPTFGGAHGNGFTPPKEFEVQHRIFLGHLEDYKVSEIVLNCADSTFVKKSGVYYDTGIRFRDDDEYFDFIERVVVKMMKATDEYVPNNFLFEAPIHYLEKSENGGVIPSKARCNIVLPPVCDLPLVTIAKKTNTLISLDKIAAHGSMSTEMMNFLEACVKARCNIVFSGSTGSGKTTIMESMCKLIDPKTRIGVAEDVPELSLPHKNIVYTRSRPWKPGMREEDVATLDWVIQQFQRMRVERILCGEVRGKEFNTFLVAANSGIEGSMTTMHADNPEKCKQKMTQFALKGADTDNIMAINTQISNVVDIIVQLIRTDDGRYRCTHIYELGTVISDDNHDMNGTLLYEWNPIEDRFYRRNNVSDYLREKMGKSGIDCKPFHSFPVNTPMEAHKIVSVQPVEQHYDIPIPGFTSTPLGNGLMSRTIM